MTGSAHASGIARALVPNRDARVRRALRFLGNESATGHFASYVSMDPRFFSRVEAPEEVFTPMLILNALADCALELPNQSVQFQRLRAAFTREGLVHFFSDRELLVADADCTAVLLDLMLRHGEPLDFDPHRTLDAIAANVDPSGVLRVYLNADQSRADRVDATVCANALYAFYSLGRQQDVAASEDYVFEHVCGSNLDDGTRYYPSPDVFLMFLSRLTRDFDGPRRRFTSVVRDRLRERFGRRNSTVLDQAARVAAAENVGLLAEDDLDAIVRAQQADGSWTAAPCFRFGRKQSYFGGECLSTAWGIRALMADTETLAVYGADAGAMRERTA